MEIIVRKRSGPFCKKCDETFPFRSGPFRKQLTTVDVWEHHMHNKPTMIIIQVYEARLECNLQLI